ncbi:MAG: hypothetical protein HPY76_05660 [Anaerolineae bacterium]|nr:hypothetical protein [Anaerolineae bacterium]
MKTALTHFLPLTLVRRARLLPASGKVLVRYGQQVSGTEVIAQARLQNHHLLVDLSRTLRISPEKAAAVCDRKVGETVQEGDILADMGGLLRRVVRAPADGEIVALQRGKVLIEIASEVITLKAGLSGTVAEVFPDRGAVIEGAGALAQGIWGNGLLDVGVLHVLAQEPLDDFTPRKLDISMRGAVVLGGHCCQANALHMAAELPLRGLVLGSMTADLIPLANSMKFPVILLEGFGRHPINPVAFKFLSTNHGREICLNAAILDDFEDQRPEAFIPLPAGAHLPREMAELKPGMQVRMVNLPYAGQVGTLVTVEPELTQVIAGVRARAAVVKLENDQKITLPLANLDVLE